tara:strand:+ start:613 stop:978 length:366 start_codon:yes stop_codon:yes gene_type:complete
MEYKPRDLLLNYVKKNKVDIDKHKWNNYIIDSVINGIYYTIIDYIHVSRKTSEKLMSYLEIDFYLTDEFIETDYPELYIQANRKFHENGLILHIFDNFHKIDSPPHRRMMFYFMNILYFDL